MPGSGGWAVKGLGISPVLVDFTGNVLRVAILTPFAVRDRGLLGREVRTTSVLVFCGNKVRPKDSSALPSSSSASSVSRSRASQQSHCYSTIVEVRCEAVQNVPQTPLEVMRRRSLHRG